MSDAAYKLSPGDTCVVVLDRYSFIRLANQMMHRAANFIWLEKDYSLLQFSLGSFVIQDATGVALLAEIQREEQGY